VIDGESVEKIKEDAQALRKDFQKINYCFENATEAYDYIGII
jgi:hypothetical protein